MTGNGDGGDGSGLTRRLAGLFNEYDGAFLLSRVALVVPVLVASRAMATSSAFSAFSEAYHVGLFLAGIALYGAHEAYLVDRSGIRSGVYHLLLNSLVLAGLGLALDAGGLVVFTLPLFAFAVLFRAAYLYFITLYRHDVSGYLILSAALLVTCAVLVLRGTTDLLDLLPLLAVYLVFSVHRGLLRSERLRRAFRSYAAVLKEHFHYVGNYVLSSMYVQGALFLYAFTASEAEYARATHFVYILGGTYILLDLLYRKALLRFSESDTPSTKVLLQTLAATGALAVATALPLVPLMPPVESLLFAERMLDPTLALLLAGTLVVHSTNFAWSAYLIGSGRIDIQFRLTAATGALLLVTLLALEALDVQNALAPAFLVTSAGSSLMRGVTSGLLLRSG